MSEESPIIQQNCGKISWNILNANPYLADFRSSMIIREISKTEGCFKEIRDLYQNYLGNDSFKRILQYKSTVEDEEKAAQVLLHYRHLIKKKLIAELSLHRKVQYYSGPSNGFFGYR